MSITVNGNYFSGITIQQYEAADRELAGLSSKTKNALIRAGLLTRSAVARASDLELLSLRNFGKGMFQEVRSAIPSEEAAEAAGDTAGPRLTAAELEITALLGDCWNKFAALPDHHLSDSADFVFHIHALQNIVMARLAARVHPDHFYRQDEEKR